MEPKTPVKVETSKSATLAPFGMEFPFPMFGRLSRELDTLFGRFGREPFFLGAAEAPWQPEVEMLERGNELIVRADVPGLKKDEITVEVTENELVLKGERKHEKEEKAEGYYRAERSYGSFFRALPLPEGVKIDQAKASIHEGVLEVTMPLAKIATAKRRLEIVEPATGEKPAKHAA